jgi:alkylation response protein AidB-like acyl-CoA dehydrogenase
VVGGGSRRAPSARALHTHGGYGLSLDYDIQLYHSRAKAWPLAGGDPRAELRVAAERLWGGSGAATPLPDAATSRSTFGLGADALAFADEAQRFFAQSLTPERRARAHFAWEGHDPDFQRELARAGLLFPSWPREYGGQGRGRYEMWAFHAECLKAGWVAPRSARPTWSARTLMAFASEELKREVLPRIARGDAICSSATTEPEFGSDVASRKDARGPRRRGVGDRRPEDVHERRQHRAVRVPADRTNPAAPKHRGLTMFLVPLDTPGIEIQPVETISDERTNVTYYNGVRVPDRYRVGGIDQGWSVLAHALDLEHGGGFAPAHRQMLAGAVELR